MHHLPELLSRDPRFAFALFLNEMQLLGDIARAEKQYAFAGQPVAPGASRFLIIALKILWEIVMHDETHIRFVDAHAKRDRRGNDACIIAQKKFLILGPFSGRQPRVIWLRADPIFAQPNRQRICAFSACAINNAALVCPAANESEQLLVGCRFGHDAIIQIRTVEAGDVTARFAQFQLLDDVDPDPLGGRCRERHHRHVREVRPQFFQLAIFRPKIVTPFADAMRFINRDLRDIPIQRAF